MRRERQAYRAVDEEERREGRVVRPTTGKPSCRATEGLTVRGEGGWRGSEASNLGGGDTGGKPIWPDQSSANRTPESFLSLNFDFGYTIASHVLAGRLQVTHSDSITVTVGGDFYVLHASPAPDGRSASKMTCVHP